MPLTKTSDYVIRFFVAWLSVFREIGASIALRQDVDEEAADGGHAGRIVDIHGRLRSANNGRERVQQWMHQTAGYSITSSALARTVAGTSRPSAFAVFRLITSSYLVGA